MPDRRPVQGYPIAAPSGQRRGEAATGGEAGRLGEAGPGRMARVVPTAARRILTSRPVRWGFAGAAVALGGYAVARQWPGVRPALASIGLLTVAAAMVSVLIAMVAAMQAWRLMLAALGSPLPVRVAARIMFIGQLGKYVPGSVWPMLAQMELGNAHEVPRHHSASASVLTTLVSLLSGLLAALATLLFVARSTPYLWALLAVPVLLGCLHPRVLNALLARLFQLTRRSPLDRPLTGRAVAGALAWWLGAWICYGLQIWLLTIRLGAPRGTAALVALGGFALAWCVGFVAVFAPAGAGVREVLLVALLGPILGAGAATAVALVSRVLTTAGALLAAATAAVYFRHTRRPEAAASDNPVTADSPAARSNHAGAGGEDDRADRIDGACARVRPS